MASFEAVFFQSQPGVFAGAGKRQECALTQRFLGRQQLFDQRLGCISPFGFRNKADFQTEGFGFPWLGGLDLIKNLESIFDGGSVAGRDGRLRARWRLTRRESAASAPS